jgi:hypothetical protein
VAAGTTKGDGGGGDRDGGRGGGERAVVVMEGIGKGCWLGWLGCGSAAAAVKVEGWWHNKGKQATQATGRWGWRGPLSGGHRKEFEVPLRPGKSRSSSSSGDTNINATQVGDSSALGWREGT